RRERPPVAQLDRAPASGYPWRGMPRAPFGVVLAVAAAAGLVPNPTWTRGPERVDFQRDVQPILRERCYNCHGASKQQNVFRLDRRRDAMRGGTTVVITPGSAQSSRLYL